MGYMCSIQIYTWYPGEGCMSSYLADHLPLLWWGRCVPYRFILGTPGKGVCHHILLTTYLCYDGVYVFHTDFYLVPRGRVYVIISCIPFTSAMMGYMCSIQISTTWYPGEGCMSYFADHLPLLWWGRCVPYRWRWCWEEMSWRPSLVLAQWSQGFAGTWQRIKCNICFIIIYSMTIL